MKRSICIASITLIAMSHFADASAQNAENDVAEPPHRLVEGAWALQFGVSTSSLSPFSGSTISAKHHFSAGRALRYGLDVRADYRDREDVDPRHDIHVSLSTLYLAYPTLSDEHGADIHLFYGVGPEVGFSRRAFGSLDETQFIVGGTGAIGAEWFVKTRISLSAEYRTSATFGWGNHMKSFRLNPVGGRMGVSIYF